jgi:hypothetical protein
VVPLHQDEKGVAAYKTIELDDALGGGPVQYREVQESESQLFTSYFKETGISYVPGGVASGFAKVERDVWPTRLLHVKGSRVVRAKEVPVGGDFVQPGEEGGTVLMRGVCLMHSCRARRSTRRMCSSWTRG